MNIAFIAAASSAIVPADSHIIRGASFSGRYRLGERIKIRAVNCVRKREVLFLPSRGIFDAGEMAVERARIFVSERLAYAVKHAEICVLIWEDAAAVAALRCPKSTTG